MSDEERTKRKISFDQIPLRQRTSLEAQLPKFSKAKGCGCLLILLVVLLIALNAIFGEDDKSLEKPAPTQTQQPAQQSAAPTDNVTSARQTFLEYHKAITDKNYRAAYEILSYKQRERVGNFDSFAASFADTISSDVSELNLVSSDEDSCTFDYTLTARDRYQGSKVKVQTFRGQVIMATDKGHWFIRHAKSNKVNESIE